MVSEYALSEHWRTSLLNQGPWKVNAARHLVTHIILASSTWNRQAAVESLTWSTLSPSLKTHHSCLMVPCNRLIAEGTARRGLDYIHSLKAMRSFQRLLLSEKRTLTTYYLLPSDELFRLAGFSLNFRGRGVRHSIVGSFAASCGNEASRGVEQLEGRGWLLWYARLRSISVDANQKTLDDGGVLNLQFRNKLIIGGP